MSLNPRTTLQHGQVRPQGSGFTLIEVMITVLVLSVGILGIATLQATAKRSSHQAWQRTLAVNLADDIVERIRINPSRAADYHTGLGASALGDGSIAEDPKDCSDEVCSPDEIVASDLWNWERQLDGATIRDSENHRVGGLLDARGCIVFQQANAGTPNTGLLRVVVSWQGLAQTTDAVQTGTACGTGAATTQRTRRQVVVNTYVIDEGELNP